MGDPRPTDPDLTQDDQAALLRPTGNGSTEPDEDALLADLYDQTDGDQ